MLSRVRGDTWYHRIRGEVKAVVVEGVLTTLLEGRMDLMCERQVGALPNPAVHGRAPLGHGWN